MSSISKLIKQKVNRFGELHLDVVQAELLVSWIEGTEKILDDQAKLVGELQILMKGREVS